VPAPPSGVLSGAGGGHKTRAVPNCALLWPGDDASVRHISLCLAQTIWAVRVTMSKGSSLGPLSHSPNSVWPVRLLMAPAGCHTPDPRCTRCCEIWDKGGGYESVPALTSQPDNCDGHVRHDPGSMEGSRADLPQSCSSLLTNLDSTQGSSSMRGDHLHAFQLLIWSNVSDDEGLGPKLQFSISSRHL